MLVVWPFGVPVLYAVLLFACREALVSEIPTALSRATAFLSDDYVISAFWWESLELCRKLVLVGWLLLIPDDAQQARVLVAILFSVAFFGLRLLFMPTLRAEDRVLATLTDLALILVYTCILVIKTCDAASETCEAYGFGGNANGVFLFFLFFGLTMILAHLSFEVIALVNTIRKRKKLPQLRHRNGVFVELPAVTEKHFSHLPGLETSVCYHLFLSHAWPLGQDVCKLIKQRYREICPSMRVFLDVEDLATGSGTKEVDHSLCILVFAMAVYFEKVNCVKELIRAIVRHKQITLLLPDSEVHGVLTQAMIREIVTGEWLQSWQQLHRNLAEWASEWGVAKIELPTCEEILDALFKRPPLEWSRITPFQDRTMVLVCQRLLPEADEHDIYLQGSASFALPERHVPVKVYCSPHNPGATELAEELNLFVMNRGRSRSILQSAVSFRRSLTRAFSNRSPSESEGGASDRLLEIVDIESWDALSKCDHMLVYLNAQTWTHDAEPLAAEIREAQRQGLHLQPCHEMPSVIDRSSPRSAQEFKAIMDATPNDLKKSPTNIYSQIAIALKGGELREPGLAILAGRLAQRVRRTSGSWRRSTSTRSVD